MEVIHISLARSAAWSESNEIWTGGALTVAALIPTQTHPLKPKVERTQLRSIKKIADEAGEEFRV
jgi:hypothetical protein